MMISTRAFLRSAVLATFLVSPVLAQSAAPVAKPAVTEGDFQIHDFKFDSGETLPSLNLHYRTLGQPARNARGQVTNAVLIMHGTGGTGGAFLSDNFGGVLFGPGQL